MNRIRHIIVASILTVTFGAACGDGDDGTQVGSNNTDQNNTSTNNANNTNPNNTSTNSANNTNPNNTNPNNTSTNNTSTGNATARISSPAGSDIVTGGTVDIDITVDGTVHTMSLLVDGVQFADVTGLDSYELNTSSIEEGVHVISLEFTEEDGGETFTSESTIGLTVDHTNPSIVERQPGINQTGVDFRRPLVIEFSEPIANDGSATGFEITANGVSLGLSATWPSDSEVYLTIEEQALGLPAQATINIEGLSDVAGNTMSNASWNFGLVDGATVALDAGMLESRHVVWNGVDTEVVAQLTNNGLVYKVLQLDETTGEYAQLGAELSTTNFRGMDAFVDENDVLYLLEFEKPTNATRASLEVHTFDGTAWSSIGGPSGTISIDSASDGDVSMAAVGGEVMIAVALEGGKLYTYLYDGSTWASRSLPNKDDAHRAETRLLVANGNFAILEARCTSSSNGTCANTRLSFAVYGTSAWTPPVLNHDVGGSCDRFKAADLGYHDSDYHLIVGQARQCQFSETNPYETKTYRRTNSGWDELGVATGGADLQPDPEIMGLAVSEVELRSSGTDLFAMVQTQEDIWVYQNSSRGWRLIATPSEDYSTERDASSTRLQNVRLGLDWFGRPVVTFNFGSARSVYHLYM